MMEETTKKRHGIYTAEQHKKKLKPSASPPPRELVPTPSVSRQNGILGLEAKISERNQYEWLPSFATSPIPIAPSPVPVVIEEKAPLPPPTPPPKVAVLSKPTITKPVVKPLPSLMISEAPKSAPPTIIKPKPQLPDVPMVSRIYISVKDKWVRHKRGFADIEFKRLQKVDCRADRFCKAILKPGEDKNVFTLVETLLKSHKFSIFVFVGPPGSGKTMLLYYVAKLCGKTLCRIADDVSETEFRCQLSKFKMPQYLDFQPCCDNIRPNKSFLLRVIDAFLAYTDTDRPLLISTTTDTYYHYIYTALRKLCVPTTFMIHLQTAFVDHSLHTSDAKTAALGLLTYTHQPATLSASSTFSIDPYANFSSEELILSVSVNFNRQPSSFFLPASEISMENMMRLNEQNFIVKTCLAYLHMTDPESKLLMVRLASAKLGPMEFQKKVTEYLRRLTCYFFSMEDFDAFANYFAELKMKNFIQSMNELKLISKLPAQMPNIDSYTLTNVQATISKPKTFVKYLCDDTLDLMEHRLESLCLYDRSVRIAHDHYEFFGVAGDQGERTMILHPPYPHLERFM